MRQWDESRVRTICIAAFFSLCFFALSARLLEVATMGGGSLLRGPDYGEFDHFVWVTVTDDGPVLANLLLEGIRDENVVTQRMREELLR